MSDDRQGAGGSADAVGPERRTGSAPSGGASSGGASPGGASPAGADGLDPEERLVRVLMQRAVSDVQPDPAALPRIRRAVPRRRAARRGAWTGAAALAVALAIALPTLHDDEHLGLSGGPGSPSEQSSATPAVTRGPGTTGGGSAGPVWPAHPATSGPGGTTGPSGSATASPSAWAGTADPGSGPAASSAAATAGGTEGPPVPLCTRADLGQATSQVGAPDGDGRIYGSFTVVNTSGHSCLLGGPGAVAVSGASGTDPARIRVVDHTAGDPATGLPAPVGAPIADGNGPALVLAPQAGYRVEFGWVPDSGCPAPTGASPTAAVGQAAAAGPSPAAQPGGSGGSGGVAPAMRASVPPSAAPPASASPTAGPTGAPSPTATVTTGPSTPPPTVTLSHTPAPGSPTAATAVLLGACSGTVYRTQAEPAPAPTPGPTGSPTAG
ncbi:hypothetical protein ACIGZJ_10105 [Kitasatospora sp. NPDC052868]|uniref:hypothetical protein n=1 Tax=Kitasatospora sp. NPDC052868 TaxID=3364060 RepID=UPI0037CBB19C